MANRIEAARDYLGSVANRAVGRSAWIEAMQQPKHWSDDYYKYSWSIPINHALDTAASVHAALEFLTPVTSRFIVQTLKDSKTWERSGPLDLLRLVPDLALIGATVYLSHNPLEFVAMKLATNAAIHVSLDIASVVGKGAARIFRHFRPPTAPTLAI